MDIINGVISGNYKTGKVVIRNKLLIVIYGYKFII